MAQPPLHCCIAVPSYTIPLASTAYHGMHHGIVFQGDYSLPSVSRMTACLSQLHSARRWTELGFLHHDPWIAVMRRDLVCGHWAARTANKSSLFQHTCFHPRCYQPLWATTDDSEHDQRHVRLLLPCSSAHAVFEHARRPGLALMPPGLDLHATKAYQSMSRPRSFETTSTAAAPPRAPRQSRFHHRRRRF